MKVENPAALRFIMQDDIYLLHRDKTYTGEKLPEPATETAAVKLSYLGGHKKKFLILVHYPGHDFIADAHLTALQNILKRKDYDLDDVAIFNTANGDTDFEQLMAFFDPQKLLLLGKNAIPAKLEAPMLNEPKHITGCMTLYSFSFDEMMSNVAYKKAFWDQMKNL